MVSKAVSVIEVTHCTYALVPENVQGALHAVWICSFDECTKEMGQTQLRRSHEVLGCVIEVIRVPNKTRRTPHALYKTACACLQDISVEKSSCAEAHFRSLR